MFYPKRKSKLTTDRSKLLASEDTLESLSCVVISLRAFTMVSSSSSTAFLDDSAAVQRVADWDLRVLTKLLSPFFMNMAWRFGEASRKEKRACIVPSVLRNNGISERVSLVASDNKCP